MKKFIVGVVAMLSVAGCQSAFAVEFNPMVGMQIQTNGDEVGSKKAPAVGFEIIADDGMLMGVSYSENTVRGETLTSLGWRKAEQVNKSLTMWTGKVYDNGWAAKVGYTHHTSKLTASNYVSYVDLTTDKSQDQLMLGTAYHFKNGFNLNAHLNIPFHGDKFNHTEFKDYASVQLFGGYRF